ncbi:MAG TPA: DUF3443 family protein, partial [Geobacteraceae bacterium]
MKSSKLALAFLVTIGLLMFGCGGGGGGGGTPKTLVSIAVTPATPSLPLGTTQQFTATGTFSDNSTQDLTPSVSWASSNTGVATISAAGLATSVALGTTTITATSGTISNATTLTISSATLRSVAVTPANPVVAIGGTQQFTATGTFSDNSTHDVTASATWSSSVTTVATISNAAGSIGKATAISAGTATIAATSGGISGGTTLTVPVGGGGTGAANVLSVTVNGSLCSAGSYPNKPCVNVTVCTPGTTTCQTITDILLDTGSFGLRIFQQALTVPLNQVPAGTGALAECIQFVDGSSDWGPVKTASVILGGEPAVTVPIHVMDSTFFGAARPTVCANPDTGPAIAGFNGILGVGLFVEDCGTGCANSANNQMYFSCSGTTCPGTAVAIANQVQNPVASLPVDNNGVLVQLPTVAPGGAPSDNGQLVLGIGTQTNNTPNGVTTFPASPFTGEFTTVFNGTAFTNSFIDSGS